MKGYLQQVHPVLPVKDVTKSLEFYIHKLGFEFAFSDDETKPFYAGVKRDNIEIHLQWYDEKEWGTIDRPMLRFVTQHIEALYDDYKTKDVFHKNTSFKKTEWGT